MAIDDVQRIAAAVAARQPISGIRIVGVDGPSGSGKTHLARGLAEAPKRQRRCAWLAGSPATVLSPAPRSSGGSG